MKPMHHLTLLLFLPITFLFSIPVNAQWTVAYQGDPAPEFDMYFIYILSVVDTETVWATVARGHDDFSQNEFVRTVDGGASWTKGTIPDSGLTSYTIHIFGLDKQTAWATRVTLPEEKSFVYKTTDGGDNWSLVQLPMANDTTILIATHFLNPLEGFAYAETHNGTDWYIEAYYTSDGGNLWEVANTPYLAGERVFIWHGNNNYAVHGDTIWFGTSLSRIFRSVDKGHNWEAISVPFFHTRMVESVAFLDAENGIAATALSDSLGGSIAANDAFITQDGGTTWTHLPIPNGIFTDPRMMGLCAIPGTTGTYMLYGYWQNDFKYKQMVTHDNGMTWFYVEGAENKNRCIQFISPTHGWGGGWAYKNFQTTIVEQVSKWTGPPLIGGSVPAEEEWNRLQAALQIDPNPAHGQVQLQILDNRPENYQVEIFDLSGKPFFTGIIGNNRSQIISVNDWPKATYVIKVSGKRGNTARVLIVQ